MRRPPVAAALLAAAALLGACRARPEAPPLRILISSAPVSLDPHLQDEANTFGVLGNVFEGLTGFDGDMRLQPVLAERWESPDDLTWRFHLRPGVRFHDGRALTAADVVKSLQRARGPKSLVAGYLVAVRDVNATDAQTVEVRTERPYPLLLNKLAFVFVVPQDAPDEITAPVGTGPYRLVTGASRGLHLQRFDGYWGVAPAEPRLIFLPVESGADRRKLLLDGQADVAATLPDNSEPAPPGIAIEWHPSLSVAHLGLRVDRPPLSDVRVRRAVSLAIDREAIVRTVLAGRGQPATQFVAPNVFGFDPARRPLARDTGAARRLLAEAGFRAGQPLTLEHAGGLPIVTALAQQLGEAGIPVQLVPRSWTDLYPRLVAGEVPLFYIGLACSSGDASDALDGGLHRRGPDGYGESNFSGYANPQVDALVEESAQALGTDRRRQLLQRAQQIALTELPMIPLWQRPLVYGRRDEVEWTVRADGRPYGRDMRRR